MKQINFKNSRFVTSVFSIKALPSFIHMPEIAVIGRSNVGKSSLLNHLFHTKSLVKISSSPGKTCSLNFFNVDEKCIFVDLPGYGYAKVSKEQKQHWGNLIQDYLNHRTQLSLILLLLDIRRDTLSEEDLMMLDWIEHHHIRTLIVFTKVDKVNTSTRNLRTKQISDRLKGIPHVHYSVIKNLGRKELINKITELVSTQ